MNCKAISSRTVDRCSLTVRDSSNRPDEISLSSGVSPHRMILVLGSCVYGKVKSTYPIASSKVHIFKRKKFFCLSWSTVDRGGVVQRVSLVVLATYVTWYAALREPKCRMWRASVLRAHHKVKRSSHFHIPRAHAESCTLIRTRRRLIGDGNDCTSISSSGTHLASSAVSDEGGP